MFGHTPNIHSKSEADTLVEQVIQEASKTFIPGMRNSDKLFFKMVLRPGSRSYPDPHFRSDANNIPHSNLVASMGPQFADMANFFLDTAFNPTKPIEKIVALCDPTTIHTTDTADSMLEGDCYDYFLTSREVEINDFSFKIKRLAGHMTTEEAKDTIPAGLIQSELEIKTKLPSEPEKNSSKKLQVTFFEITDGNAITLNHDYQKQIVWDLNVYAQSHPILVHCRSGIGRTGNFIFMLEILKDYDTVFASQHPKTIAENIHAILKRLRTVRPALVLAPEQFASAIRNARILHNFALGKGYVNQAEKTAISPLKRPAEPPKTAENGQEAASSSANPSKASGSDQETVESDKKPKLR
ncbi:MAG: protein-tyrosine phosphatase family protein [Gammaproteobacteria bacterium]|nr:protein-tyrosine phosphatase family protein [Gammaproteobacteria bacterium]